MDFHIHFAQRVVERMELHQGNNYGANSSDPFILIIVENRVPIFPE